MIELDEAMRQALLARDGPPAGASEEILAGLRVRIAVPGSGGPDHGGGSEALGGDGLEAVAQQAGQAAWSAKIVGATIGLTGAGLLVLKLGALGVATLGSDAPRTDEQAQAPTHPQAHEPAPASSERPLEPAPIPAAESAPGDVGSADSSGTSAGQRSSGAAKAVEPDNSGSDLAAEIALLREAKRLRATAPQAALDQLERHREQFPSGTLAPERDALRVELLCALGRVSQAEAAREQFPITHPGSPLGARVEKSCRGTDPERDGD